MFFFWGVRVKIGVLELLNHFASLQSKDRKWFYAVYAVQGT